MTLQTKKTLDSCTVNKAIDSTNQLRYNVGNYINKELDDDIKRNLLLNPWVSPKNYEFPYSEHKQGGKIVTRRAKRADLDALTG